MFRIKKKKKKKKKRQRIVGHCIRSSIERLWSVKNRQNLVDVLLGVGLCVGVCVGLSGESKREVEGFFFLWIFEERKGKKGGKKVEEEEGLWQAAGNTWLFYVHLLPASSFFLSAIWTWTFSKIKFIS